MPFFGSLQKLDIQLAKAYKNEYQALAWELVMWWCSDRQATAEGYEGRTDNPILCFQCLV